MLDSYQVINPIAGRKFRISWSLSDEYIFTQRQIDYIFRHNSNGMPQINIFFGDKTIVLEANVDKSYVVVINHKIKDNRFEIFSYLSEDELTTEIANDELAKAVRFCKRYENLKSFK